MKIFWVVWVAILTSSVAQAQRTIELGIRAGGTFTHGFTVIPAQSVSAGLDVPRIRNINNGIGVGYMGGLWIRKNVSRYYLQAEFNYSSLVLKQKAPIDRIDVAAVSKFGITLPITLPPGTLFAQLNTTSEPTLNSINIPVFIGKQWQEGRWRVYGGPYLLFTHQAKAVRTASGQVGPNASINFPGYTITNMRDQVDLTKPDEAGILEVKKFNFGVEFGAGFTPLKRLEVDVRYGLPVGGIFNDRGISGFIGFVTLTAGYKLIAF